MKILVLQLARFGDIYMTWPVLRALRRQHPHAQIDFVVRSRFCEATIGLDCVDSIIEWNTREMLQPVFDGDHQELSLSLISGWVKNLKSQQYDRIINLSFSPLSSYLTHAISTEKTKVTGYSRYEDGYLSIPDDASAYFYAQVGIDRVNRYHLIEIFAAVAQVELADQDWRAPVEILLPRLSTDTEMTLQHIPKPWMVMQIGASQKEKIIPVHILEAVARQVEAVTPYSIILVGSLEERGLADSILSQQTLKRTYSLVGRTKISDLFRVLKEANVVVSPDSVTQHMASLTQTPVVNLSCSAAKFWETGPRSPMSRVVYAHEPEMLSADRIVAEVRAIMGYSSPYTQEIRACTGTPVAFEVLGQNDYDFEWSLTEALYTKSPYPIVQEKLQYDAIQRIQETAVMALERVQALLNQEGDKVLHFEVLNQVDVILDSIEKIAPCWSPLLNWYRTEKIRMSPDSVENLLQKSKSIYQQLLQVTEVYSSLKQQNERGSYGHPDDLVTG